MPTSAKIRQKKLTLDERIAALQREKAQEQAKLIKAVRKEHDRENRRAGVLLRALGFALHDLEALRARLEPVAPKQATAHIATVIPAYDGTASSNGTNHGKCMESV